MPKKKNVEEVVEEVTTVDEVEEVVEEVEEPTVDPEPTAYKKGIVKGCDRLNIRDKAGMDGKRIETVPVKTELTVKPDESTKEWLSVITPSGKIGFCMKKYVTVK